MIEILIILNLFYVFSLFFIYQYLIKRIQIIEKNLLAAQKRIRNNYMELLSEVIKKWINFK